MTIKEVLERVYHAGKYHDHYNNKDIELEEAEKDIEAITNKVDLQVPWIKNGKCTNKGEHICNLGYACDGCPWNKD